MHRSNAPIRALQLLRRPRHHRLTQQPAVCHSATFPSSSTHLPPSFRCLGSSSSNNHRNQASQQQKNQRKKAGEAAKPRTFGDIHQAQTSMQALLDRLDKLQYTPPSVERMAFGDTIKDKESEVIKKQIIDENKEFFRSVCRAVEKGNLNPNRKHAKDLSRLMECVLYNYSCCASIDSQLSKECQLVLGTLRKDWNLDFQNAHYEYSIVVANQEHNFQLASRLFEAQIDPNAGHTVVPVAVDNPQGLYAIAKLHSSDLQDPSESSSAAEHVMDAVQRLVMVSPQDQTTYVLAAGNTLGFAGRWKDLLDYYKSNFTSEEYGTPLVAAVMQACWLCGRSREALQVLQESNLLVTHGVSFDGVSTTPGFGGEWQYGGERDLMDPLLRDLAMKVIPDSSLSMSATNETSIERGSIEDEVVPCVSPLSDVALDLYHQALEERVTISREALLGIVRACEQDGRWQEASSILTLVFDEELQLIRSENKDSWIVPGNELFIEERGRRRKSHGVNNIPKMGELVASVMRSCNASSNFGMSLFFLNSFDLLLSTRDRRDLLVEKEVSMDEKFDGFLSRMDDPHGVLTASMVALCGLRCNKQAIDLYNASPNNCSSAAASTVNKYAMTNQTRFGTLILGNPWVSAHQHIEQLLQVIRIVAENDNVSISDDPGKMQHVEQILGRAMNSCTNAHQPELSLLLLRWTNNNIVQTKDYDSPALFSDLVTAETILARRWVQDAEGAADLFESVIKANDGKLSEWRLTIAAGLTAMIASGRGDHALAIFKNLEDSAFNTDVFPTIGRYLSKRSEWRAVIDLYRAASVKGFSSEELSLMAMKAVTSTKIDNRLRILRAIADDCAANLGMDAQTWMTTKYWHIKRELGFYHARLLMWWNDPDLALVDELNLAIKEFYSEVSNDLRPKNDVVRAIVEGPNLLESIGLQNLKGYEKVPRTEEQWSSILSELIEATIGSPIQYDPNFVDSVVRAYRSLGRSRECVEYVSKLMSVDGIRVRKSTLSEALEAARLEQADALYKDIESMLSQRKSSSNLNE